MGAVMCATERLVQRFGPIITRASEQVARQFAAREGYEVVAPEDIEQAVYEQFLSTGVTDETLAEMDEPQGYIRTTARYYGAANQARAARRATPVSFRPSHDRRDLGALLLRTRSGGVGEPEVEVLAAEAILEAVTNAQAILNRVGSPSGRVVAVLFYLDGLNSYEIADRTGQSAVAVRKALQRARDDIGEEADASLRAWRVFAHPSARRPRRVAT